MAEQENKPSKREAIERLSFVLGNAHNNPVAQALLPVLDIIADQEDRLGRGEEALGGYGKRFADEDAKAAKSKSRKDNIAYWNDALEKAPNKDAVLEAAKFIRSGEFKRWKDAGYDDDKITKALDDDLENFMSAARKHGQNPAEAVYQIAIKGGWKPAEAKEAAKQVTEEGKMPDNISMPKKVLTGEETDTDEQGKPDTDVTEADAENEDGKAPAKVCKPADANPDAERVQKMARKSPDSDDASRGRLTSEERLKIRKEKGVAAYKKALGY